MLCYLTSHKSTASVLHEHTWKKMFGTKDSIQQQIELTLVFVSGCSGHLYDNIIQRGCLGDLPVETGSRGCRWHLTKVDDEVPD